MEELGEEYLQDLLARSFFQSSSHKGRTFFRSPSITDELSLQMHDLVHDLAIFVSYDFCFRLDNSSDIHGLSSKIRHLSYMEMWRDDDHTLKCLSVVNCLRTFIPLSLDRLGCEVLFYPYDIFFKAGSFLRVLSLPGIALKMFNKLPHSIGNLKQLRYLDLCNISIRRLPDSICTLYNLQTLLLSYCDDLRELPKKMGSLINLRYLDIEAVPLKETPREIGNMKHLHFLSDVALSDKNGGGFEMKSVAKLANLRCISGLENIKDAREASEANLIDKKGLLKLTLSWNDNGTAADNSQEEKDILDALRPHTNLRFLEIENYRGTTFSDWIGDSAFSNLVEIRLVDCKNCCILPQLGQLPCLKYLDIEGCDNVISVGDDGNNHTSPLFGCLESISFDGMLEWKDWSFSSEAMQQGRIFPLLGSLTLKNCPKLNVGIPGYLPSLESLYIFKCEQMAVLLPRTQQTVATPPSVVSPHERSCPELESQLDGGSHWKVKSLTLYESKMLFENRKEWDLHRFSCLQDFSISDWEDVSFPDDGLLPTTLTNLQIWDTSKLETLNGKAFQQLASLTSLSIRGCENLRCLPEEGLPTSLSSLGIEQCPLLKQRCEEGGEDWSKIQHINSVKKRINQIISTEVFLKN